MIRLLILCFVLFCFQPLSAQEGFPVDWTGRWKGTLQIYPAGNAPVRTVDMELRIGKTDTLNQYQWQITYGEPGQDNRPYLLKAVDTARGHWVIDERNSIVLDQYWIGGQLTGAFSLSGVKIISRYWMENGRLNFEITSLAMKPVNTTGMGTEEIPSVDSYRVTVYQRARLERQ